MRASRIISFAVILSLVVIVWPHPAHAGIFGEVSLDFLELVHNIVKFVADILTGFIAWLGDRIQQILELPLSTGGPAVYAVWKLFRDTCNLLFIALFIAMAFGTIFNVVWKNDYYYSSAIKGVLIAAISINFSLAIGQTVIWGGNEATRMVLELIGPRGTGAEIAASLKIPEVIAGMQLTDDVAIPQPNTPADLLTPKQRVLVETWTKQGYTKSLTVLKDCLEHNGDPTDCMVKVGLSSEMKEDIAAAVDRDTAQQGGVGGVTGILGYWSGVLNGNNPLNAPPPVARAANDWKTYVSLIGSVLVQIFLLLVLSLSFLAMAVFMVIRIPAMWLFLSISALAFFTYAVPGKSMLKNWFNGLLAWSIFSPLYLFIVYIGLYVLGQKGTLINSLEDAGGNIPFLTGSLAYIMFFLIAGAIFIGGAGWALKYSFSLGKGISELSVGTWFEATAGKWFGISEKEKFGGALAARITGIAPAYKAGRERVQQFGSDVVAGARGRLPSLLKTEEEALALRRRQFGVRGGAEGVAKVTGDAIRKEQDILSAAIKAREAEAAARGKTFDETAFLREKAGSGNRQIAFAAKEILTTKGKLDAASMKQTAEEYAGISAIARQSYLERVSKQLSEKAEKKEYKDAADVLSSLDILTKPQQDKLLKSLERNQPLIAAALADKFYTRPDGSKARASDILERNARAISNSDWAKILEEAKAGNVTLTKPLEEILTERTKKLTDYLEMVRTAKPDQQVEIAHIAALAENLRRQKGNRKQSKKQR